MAMAKARQTAAQKAAAPRIARRAMKAPRVSSETSVSPGMRRSFSTSMGGIARPMQRPSKPPMIMVGATTPAGFGSERAKIVMVHLKRKHRNMVQCGPSSGSDHSCWEWMRSLSNKWDSNAGCGLPPKSGKPAAMTVLMTTTTAIWKMSRHSQHLQETKEAVMCLALILAFSVGVAALGDPPPSRRSRSSLYEIFLTACCWTAAEVPVTLLFKRHRFMAPTTFACKRIQRPPAKPQTTPMKTSKAKMATGYCDITPSLGWTSVLISGNRPVAPAVQVL
mmetsp:Transcript_48363/g.149402  ORF Transcript_48363/g.149402 Transcript_48363/m.149402 type:complete len:278 (+) Transcript_48363:738-1571(+)